jgi:transposase
VGADRLGGHVEARRVTAEVTLEFLKDIRRRYPAQVTVYIVMDNLSAHRTPDIRRWVVENNVGLLPTPTNASHLNRIECHFWAFAEFVIKGSGYSDWREFTKAAQTYIRRRNRDRHDPRIIESREPPKGRVSYRRINPRRPISGGIPLFPDIRARLAQPALLVGATEPPRRGVRYPRPSLATSSIRYRRIAAIQNDAVHRSERSCRMQVTAEHNVSPRHAQAGELMPIA